MPPQLPLAARGTNRLLIGVRRLPLLLVALLPFLASCGPDIARTTGPLRQDVYVWQRSHRAPVVDAIRNHAAAFHTTVVLAAEVVWERPLFGAPIARVARVNPSWSALASAHEIGLALRINPYPGTFADDDGSAARLAQLAHDVLADAAAHGVHVSELQMDYDTPTSKLAGYRRWVQAVRAAAVPVPLFFTAVPAWLRSEDFTPLARSADGYVLQLHAIVRPRDLRSLAPLCDPDDARAAIERAARIGVPYRVALPTYGYLLAFDPTGAVTGFSAEGRHPLWDPRWTVREVHAEATELAPLIRDLSAEHPTLLAGVIWYRMPVEGDTLNWTWPTLSSVMRGRAPAR